MEQRDKMAFSIDEFCHWASIGRSLTYREIESGRLKTKKVGRRTIVTLGSAIEWLDALPDSKAQNATKIER